MKLMIACSALWLSTFACSAPELQLKWTATISVAVTAGQADVETLVGSLIKRELRSLGDLVVVATNGEYRVDIVVSDPLGSKPADPYYAVSSVLTARVDLGILSELHYPSNFVCVATNLTAQAVHPCQHEMFVCLRSRMHGNIEQLVAGWDRNFFEFNRNLHVGLLGIVLTNDLTVQTSAPKPHK